MFGKQVYCTAPQLELEKKIDHALSAYRESVVDVSDAMLSSTCDELNWPSTMRRRDLKKTKEILVYLNRMLNLIVKLEKRKKLRS